jgi:hypothetical protein
MWRLRCSRRVCHLCPTLGEDVVVHSKHNRVYGTPQLASNTLIVVSNTLWLIEARGYDLATEGGAQRADPSGADELDFSASPGTRAPSIARIAPWAYRILTAR